MFSTEDTIVAIATPPGRGGIGVVRVSGPAALSAARQLTRRTDFEPRHATFTCVDATPEGRDSQPIDRVIVTFFPAPHSYTGEDVIEVSAHGSPVVLEEIVRGAMRAGARLANPGEFTLRAYLNGRLDLLQAEAVADLIDAVTPLQARVAFDQLEGTVTSRLREMDARLLDVIAPLEASIDFPEEGYHFITREDARLALDGVAAGLEDLLAGVRRGRMIREGLTAAIVGRPNAGKSSLFNRLAGGARAIVTDVPGTTRDLLTERVDIDGILFTLIDTAGLRARADDAIEEEGIARARQAGDSADILIVVLDGSSALTEADAAVLAETAARQRVVVVSKADLPRAWEDADLPVLPVSSITDAGIDRLRQTLVACAGSDAILRDRPAIANVRHAALLEQAHAAILRARGAASDGAPEELVLADLHDARAAFDDITGARAPDDVLRTIFERFCIGK